MPLRAAAFCLGAAGGGGVRLAACWEALGEVPAASRSLSLVALSAHTGWSARALEGPPASHLATD